MKNNLKIFLTPLFAAVLILSVFVSCKKDDDGGKKDNEPKVETETDFSVSTTTLNFPKTGGSQTVTIKSSQDILVMPATQWIKVSQSTDGQYIITVPLYEGTENRTGEISVLSGNNSEKITVTQAYSSAQTLSIPNGESTFKTGVETIDGATLIIDALWITQNSDGFSAGANTTDKERTGFIIYKYSTTSDTVKVTQAAGEFSALSLESTAMELAAQMYPAWNLGNTMEATGSGLGCETAWQKTKTTQELISYVKSLGFRAIRIPCSWYIHSDKNDNYKINADWLARVKEIVDYSVNAGLFIELNDHWDSGWLEVLGFSSSDKTYTSILNDGDYINGKIEILKNLWTQIATEFKDYDHHLIFAGLNEPFQEWNLFHDKHKELTPVLEKYNQAFVDAVRATGGNNEKRVLAVQGPSTNIESTVNYFSVPNDVIDNKLMVEIHYYDPYNFCINSGDGYASTWSSETALKTAFGKMKAKFSDNNIPVLIGEYAANWRVVKNQEKHEESLKAFYKAVNKWGPANGLVPFAWDTNYCPASRGTGGTATIIDRSKLSIYGPIAYQGVIEGVDNTSWMKF